SKLTNLHVSSCFCGVFKVYENLIGEMDKLGHTQYVYVPHRRLKKEKIVNFFNPQSEIFLRPIYNRFSSFAYFYKIKTAYSDLIKQDSICKISIVHAHTWFSDGGIAYRLFKEKGVPYVITIRSTDISVFAKYCLHTHSYARDILLNAKNIIFLSKAYKDKVFNLG